MSLMDPILKIRGSSAQTRTRKEIDTKSHITDGSHVSDARATRSEAAIDPPDGESLSFFFSFFPNDQS
jgi:hypothetical protein